jgi:hypothetical protein
MTVEGSRSPRAVQSNWKGFPCPACAEPLQYWSEVPKPGSDSVHVLLRCPQEHYWQEDLDLRTLHSSLFVERRHDLEAGDARSPAGTVGRPKPRRL